MNKTTLTIPPFGMGTATMKGYCMDAALPAPNKDDLLRLRPMSDFFDPRLSGLERDIMRYAQANPRVGYTNVQHILWGLRDAPNTSHYTRSLVQRRDLLDIVDAARPGAAQMVVQVIREHETQNRFNEDIRRLFPVLRELEQFKESLESLMDPQRSGQTIDQHLRLLNRPVPGRGNVPDEASFSALRPDVFAHSIGTGPLVVDTTIMNLSPQPFVFDPVDWIAESQLPQQRVSFSGMERSIAVSMQTDLGNFSPVVYLAESAKLLGGKALGLSDHGKAKNLSDRLGEIHRKLGGWGANPTIKQTANALPLIGNVISAYQVFDVSLSREERILAAFGAIPGYGSLLKVAGSANALSKVAQSVVKHAPGLTKASDRAEWIRDVGGLATLQVTDKDELLWQATIAVAAGLINDRTGTV